MIFTDYDLESYIFQEPIQLFYTDGNQPLAMEAKSMADVMALLEEINHNDWVAGIGPFSIELQLWFALARRSKFFKS